MNKKIAWLSGISALVILGGVGVAQAIVAEPTTSRVSVYSCTQVGRDIKIRRTSREAESTLTSTCRDAGHGLRNYTLSCTSNKEYKVSWTNCTATPPVAFVAVFDKLGVSALNKQTETSLKENHDVYSAPVTVTVPANWPNFNVAATIKNNLYDAGSYEYAFAWTDNNGKNSATFNADLAKDLVKNASFGASTNYNFSVSDSDRNKTRTILVFARNKDNVSQVANMPVKVDDIIAINVYLEGSNDTQSPNVHLNAYSLGDTVSNGTYSYRVEVGATDDNSNIKGIYVATKNSNNVVVDSFWVDGRNPWVSNESGFGSKTVNRTITRSGLRTGENYRVTATVYDMNNNARTSSVANVYLANQGDTTDPRIETDIDFNAVWVSGQNYKKFVPTLVARASDNIRVTKITLYYNSAGVWDGYTALKTCENGSGVTGCTYNFGEMTRGNFYARAWDAAGNEIESTRLSF